MEEERKSGIAFRSAGNLADDSLLSLAPGACRNVNDFEKSCRIGEGTYGTVYRATERATGTVVALKKVLLHNEKQVGFPITSLREVRLLKRLQHPNCVSLRDLAVGQDRGSVFLVFEYCGNRSLGPILANLTSPGSS
mmetsp:Transcript_49972/g.113461  ORF Transcript_49972/g.113461 Transcript_49972/m.113461 type:complete len:137 (+) Transcript_49972:56-466(+)